MLNTPVVQQQMSAWVASELSQALDAELQIGRIDMGVLNRIIINDLLLYDRSDKELLKAARLSAKFDILPLFKGKISISNIQLFGFDIHLEKPTPDSPPNFQFVINAFASKDTLRKESPHLDLRINALLIRRGQVSYHVLSEARTPGRFNANHIHVRDIIASISLKALTSDTINASIKRPAAMAAPPMRSDVLISSTLISTQNKCLQDLGCGKTFPFWVQKYGFSLKAGHFLPGLFGIAGRNMYQSPLFPSDIAKETLSLRHAKEEFAYP